MSKSKIAVLSLARIKEGPRRAVRFKKKTADGQSAPSVSAATERQERNRRLIALLRSFQESDEEQQRQGLESLKEGVEAARPGQRRVFGEGFNP